MALIDDLIERRTTITTLLSNMSLGDVGDKPNAMTADGGTSVNHVEYRLSLYKELAEINKLIEQENAIQAAIDNEDGAWELATELYPE